jgi:hypothetical protein
MTTNIKAVEKLFSNIWNNYVEVTPSASKVHQLLGTGNDVINDHVAYRTFNIGKVNIDKLSTQLIKLGYYECGEYQFKAKKLYAKHFEHNDKTLPKVFISELLVEAFSSEAQQIINKMVDNIEIDAITKENFLYSGTHWQISYDEYQVLLKESE